MTTYQVTGECAHVTVSSAAGVNTVLLYKGAFLPDNTTSERINHLLSAGLIKQVDGDPAKAPVAANPSLTPEQAGTEDKVKPAKASGAADDEVAARRKAAQEKLDSMDGVPDGRASKDVLVEYLVRQGGNYDDLAKADKADLVAMAKDRQQ